MKIKLALLLVLLVSSLTVVMPFQAKVGPSASQIQLLLKSRIIRQLLTDKLIITSPVQYN